MSVQDESEPQAVPLNLIFQHRVVITGGEIEAPETALEINPASLPQLLREALPYGQLTELELTDSLSLMIAVETVTGDTYQSSLPSAISSLDKTANGQVTDINVSIILGGSNEQLKDSPDDPYLNPRSLFASHPPNLDLDTITANFFLAGSLRLQAERIKTGFTPQLVTAGMYAFAQAQTARMIAGEIEPVISLSSRVTAK